MKSEKYFIKNKCYIALYSIFLMSCNNSKLSKTSLEIYGIFKRDDTIQLFLSENIFESYSENTSQTIKVKGKLNSQKLVFSFFLKGITQRIRIDLGENKKQDSIFIDKIILENNFKKYIYTGSELNQIFEFNENIIYLKENKVLILSDVDGRFDPYIISKNLSLLK